MIGKQIHDLAVQLWPLNRSLTGDGVRQTLDVLKHQVIPELQIYEVPSGSKVFDWTVPREWTVTDAYIVTPKGEKICNFKENNLHLVGYSVPVNNSLSLDELQPYLHSLPNQPKAIPYVTSYYAERWGFCISQDQRDELEAGEYKVVVDSELFDGSLTYGELVLKGSSDSEIFLSTYVCHPSMANNELSGPTVASFIGKWLSERNHRRFTYRIVFVPETIGSIAYLSSNLDHLKRKVVAGFNVSCVGDDRTYSYLPSRHGDALSDQVAKHVLKHIYPEFKTYKWKDRGSDERQYCSPGVDLPIASMMRSKYGEYEEYHTSLDDLTNVVTPEGLQGSYLALTRSIETLERNFFPKVTVYCEPQLGKRGLYPTLSTKSGGTGLKQLKRMMDLITWSDGKKSLLEIAELCEAPIWELYPIVDLLEEQNLIVLSEKPVSE